MRRKILIFTMFLVLLGIYFANPILKVIYTHLYSFSAGLPVIETDKKQLWIEIHDVSPGYEEKLDEVLDILEAHPHAYSKAVLFVIPNHGGNTHLRNYPGFIERLRALEKRGYIIGIHGYDHERPMSKPEFKTTREHAEELLQRGEQEFKASGLPFPSYFLPPGWRTSWEVDSILRDRFEYVYYYYFIVSPRGIIPSQSQEYVWHEYRYHAFERARKDYESLKGVVRLTIHLGAINSQEGLEFLDRYLGWIEEKSNISGA